jgi:hypothetical protein
VFSLNPVHWSPGEIWASTVRLPMIGARNESGNVYEMRCRSRSGMEPGGRATFMIVATAPATGTSLVGVLPMKTGRV